MPKVLIADKMAPKAEEIFKEKGLDVDVITGQSEDELIKIIGEYDGLAIRSSTTVTPEVIAAAKNLKVIGRAGIGVDNIDQTAATQAGVVVMNTPFGNAVTTAEHTISMMLALARHIPQANATTHEGKWEKSKFKGVEVTNKTLGIIGCGNIGAIVADRAIGLHMKVIAFDPFLSEERAVELGVKKVDIDTVLEKSDFITIHTPLNDKTRGIINADALKRTKKGVRIVNCARGGIIVEQDLRDALDDGHVAGAAIDVFETEPATDNVLFNHGNVVCTPHLAASTLEAQDNVAIQIAEQMSDYLMEGAVVNALNMPSISAEDAPRLKPYLDLVTQLGSFSGQITETALKKISIEYRGDASLLNTRPLTAMIVAEILKPQLQSINIVSAPVIAKDKGIEISETKTTDSQDLSTSITLTVTSESRTRSISGTLFENKLPRILSVEGVPIEASVTENMIYIRNKDVPGLIGGVGTILADAKYNIANFHLGRKDDNEGSAVALISLDKEPDEKTITALSQLEQILQIKALKF